MATSLGGEEEGVRSYWGKEGGRRIHWRGGDRREKSIIGGRGKSLKGKETGGREREKNRQWRRGGVCHWMRRKRGG